MSSFEINCTVEGLAPDNVTHECGTPKNLTWTGNGTHSGLSFYLFRNQLTGFKTSYVTKSKLTKLIKFIFTPLTQNFAANVKVRVKYNVDGVLKVLDEYDLGNFTEETVKYHQLLMDVDTKDNTFILLDVITTNQPTGQIKVEIDCQPSIISADFCVGFTKENQWCRKCPKPVTYYKEKLPNSPIQGLVINNVSDFNSLLDGPWYSDENLSIELPTTQVTFNSGPLDKRTKYAYDSTLHKFIIVSKCDGDLYECGEQNDIEVLLSEYTASTPHLPMNPNAKPNGLKYAIKNVAIKFDTLNTISSFTVSCTDYAEDVSLIITDGMENDEVGTISYSDGQDPNGFFKVVTPETLLKVRYKLGEGAFIKIGPRNWNTSKTFSANTTSGILNLRIAVGQNKGYNNSTPINVKVIFNCLTFRPVGFDMGVHPYSPYDAYSNPKFITKVWALGLPQFWQPRYALIQKGTPIFTDSLMTTPALPYYYGDSVRPNASNKIYQVGYQIKREYGVQVNYLVTKWLFGPRETSEVIWGPKDFTTLVNAEIFSFPDYDSTSLYVPANVQPSMVNVGHFNQIIEPSTVRTPTVYSYLLGWSGATSNEYDTNNNTFTSYDFGKEKHTPMTGFEHMLTRMTRGYMLGSSIPNLRDYMTENKFMFWGFGGSIAARLLLEWWGTTSLAYSTASLAVAHVFFWVAAFLLVVAIIAFAIMLIVPQQKLFIEKPKWFRKRYSNKPFLNNVDSVISTDIDLAFSSPGYYTDGGYIYYLPPNSTTKIPTTRTFGYKYVDGIKTLNQVDLLKDTTKREYITDVHKLFFLSYILGRPEKYSTSPPLFLSSPITALTATQSSAFIGELNNSVRMELNIEEGQFTSEVSQEDADNMAQDYFESLKDTLQTNQLSVERKPGVTNIETYFTHELKLEEDPNSLLMWYDNSNENGITVGKKLYHDVDGKLSALNGYYRNYKNSNLLFYKVTYGVVTDIFSGTTSLTSQVNGGTQNLVQTDLDYTSAWFINSFNPEDLNLSFSNNVDNLITDWNTNRFYTGSTINKGIIKNRLEAESFYLYDNNLTATNYSEAAESTYREVYPFNSLIFTYNKPDTITINSQEICGLDEVGLRFNAVDINGNVSPTYVGITFTALVYTGSSVLFDTIEVTIGPNETTSFIPLNIPISGGTITSVDIVNWISPNPFNKVTFVEGTYSVSVGFTPCDYYSGLTYQVISFGFVQYTKYDGTTVFTNRVEGIYDIDDIVEYGTLKGSIDEDYLPSANIIISDYDGCITSPRATDITIDNDSVDEGTPIDTEIAIFSTVSETPDETYIYTLVSGTGDDDNDDFNLTTGGTLSNLITLDHDVKSSYNIRVRSTDPLEGYFEKSFTITVNDVNRAPYGLTLSDALQAENTPINTIIGEFNGLDYDDNETFTYTLFDDENYPDNYFFNLHTVTNEFDVDSVYLRNSVVFNYEIRSGYTINVKVTDSGDLSYVSTFTVFVGNLNEEPTDIYLSNSSVYENLPTGTTVGTLSTGDEDPADVYLYIFNHIPGTENDNDSFYIDGNLLKTKETFDYETKSTYDVRIRAYIDGGGHTYTKNFTINITDVYVNLTASATSDFGGFNVKCNGGFDGIITVSEVSGNGTSPYTYSKDGTTYQSSATFTGLTAGAYTIYAKESGGEVGSITGVTVTQPDALSIFVTDKVLNDCFNDNNASFKLVGGGGVGPYTYSLDGTNYSSTNTFQNKSSQTYYAYIKDANECTYGPQTINDFELTAPTATVNTTGTTCNGGSNGRIRISNPRLGNGSPYVVNLLNSEGVAIGNYTTYAGTPLLYTGLTAGTYYAYVEDNNGCEFLIETSVTQPSAVTMTFSNITKPTCYSGNTGSYRAIVLGGTGPYSYRNGGSGTFTGFSGNYVDFTNRSSATYSIQFKDANDCVSTVGTVDLNVPAPDGTISITGTTCYGGSDGMINVSALTGNSGPYSAKLEFGGVTIDTYRIITTNRTYTGLTQGTYLVYFKDGNGCEKSYGAFVTEPNEVTVTLTTTDPTCHNGTNGSIIAIATGGNGPYTYSRNGGSSYQADQTFSNLGVGSYTIHVKDSNGCTGSTSTSLIKSAPNASRTITNAVCFGDNGSILVSNGSGGSGTGYSASTDNVVYFSLPKTFSLPAATHTIYIKDSAGCVQSYSSVITEPTQLTSEIVNVVKPTCFNTSDGSYSINIAGGTGPYSYRINNGSYTTLSSGVSTVNFTNQSQGTYLVDVRDNNLCNTTRKTADLTRTIPNANITVTNVKCHGGSDGIILVNNGTGGTGDGYEASINSTTEWFELPKAFSSLSAGDYTIRIKDGNDCVRIRSSIAVNQPTPLSCPASGVAPTCYDGSNGSVTASGSGGTPPYTYSITNGATYVTGGTFSNLTNGSYVIRVKDANDCTANSSTVTLNRTSPTADFVITNVTCNGGTNGSIAVSNGSGGSGSGYSISIDDTSVAMENKTFHSLPKTFSSLTAGTYITYLKDSSGCVSSFSSTVSQPAVVSFTYNQTQPSCWNSSNGAITFIPSGGNGSYQYSVNNSTYTNTNPVTGLGNGNYTLRVRDTNLCYSSTIDHTFATGTPNANLSSPNYNGFNVSCFGGSDGQIVTSGPSSTSTFFRYNFGSSFSNTTGTRYNVGQTISSLTSGTWAVRVYNAGETCFRDYTITLTQPTLNIPSLSISQNPTWSGNLTNAILTLNSTGGVWPKTYRLYEDTTSPYTTCGGTLVGTWANITEANKEFNVTGLTTNGYCLEVTDANGCVTNSGVLEVPLPPGEVSFSPTNQLTVTSGSGTNTSSTAVTITVLGVTSTIRLRSSVTTGTNGSASFSVPGGVSVGTGIPTSGAINVDFTLSPGTYAGTLSVTASTGTAFTVVTGTLSRVQ